jgi:hypothetical protein
MGVAMVVDGSPVLEGHVLGPEMLDAMILAATGKAPDEILEDDTLGIVSGLKMAPRILYPTANSA